MRKPFVLFLCLFFACNSEPKIVQIKLQAEELEVIKYTFPDHDIIPWNILDAPKFPLKGFHKTKEQRERWKKTADSINRIQPKTQIWFVEDTLFNPANFSLGKEYHLDPRVKLDTIFFNLEKQLFTIKYPKQAAKLDGLMFGNYVFASVDSIKKLKKVPKRYVAISRVVFNANHNKACYYVSYSYSQVYAANADMLYVEKKKGKWFLLYVKPYWTT